MNYIIKLKKTKPTARGEEPKRYLVVASDGRMAPTTRQKAATRFVRERAHKFVEVRRADAIDKLVVVRLLKKTKSA